MGGGGESYDVGELPIRTQLRISWKPVTDIINRF